MKPSHKARRMCELWWWGHNITTIPMCAWGLLKLCKSMGGNYFNMDHLEVDKHHVSKWLQVTKSWKLFANNCQDFTIISTRKVVILQVLTTWWKTHVQEEPFDWCRNVSHKSLQIFVGSMNDMDIFLTDTTIKQLQTVQPNLLLFFLHVFVLFLFWHVFVLTL